MIIGSRKSALAMAQTQEVLKMLQSLFLDEEFSIRGISTSGDRDTKTPLGKFSSKGIFLKELEEELLRGGIDMAVHSAKDVPSELPDGLEIGAVIMRETAFDMLISRDEELGKRPVIGTGSPRREIQIKMLFPGAVVKQIRGNINTRIRKLRDGEYDAIVMAQAAYVRMDSEVFEGLYSRVFDESEMVSAPGQGMLCVEVRKGDMKKYCEKIDSPLARQLLNEERAFLEAVGGGCHTSAGAYARIIDGDIVIDTIYENEGHMKRVREYGIGCGSRAAKKCTGKVYITGAGPGGAKMASARAVEVIQSADALVYDNLVSSALIDLANDSCALIYAGKKADKHHMEQEEINSLLIKLAAEGKRVVRLKGGDPFIFGRGGEEALALEKAGIEYELVPGISSAYAAAECAGIPVTQRGVAASVHIITGHEKKGAKTVDYGAVAKLHGTLVFLMGLSQIDEITKNLIQEGKSSLTPCAVISNGCKNTQKTVFGELYNIAKKAQYLPSPAVIVVGDAVKILAPVDSGEGKSVILTGTRTINAEIGKELEKRGFEVEPISLIRTEAVKCGTLCTLSEFSHIVFVSQNGVRIFFEYLRDIKYDTRRLPLIAAVGEKSREALAEYGIYPDIVPKEHNSRALLEELLKNDVQSALIVRSEQGGHIIEDGLLTAKIPHKTAELYKTVVDERKRELLNLKAKEADYVVFASPSAVRAYKEMYDGKKELFAVAIGKTTASELERCGMTAAAVAKTQDGKGIAEEIKYLIRSHNYDKKNETP